MSEPSTLIILFRMIASLGAVVALIFALSWFVKKYIKPEQWLSKSKSGNLKVIETLILDPKKRLLVVEWETKKILLGVSEGSINFLSSENLQSFEKSEVRL